MPLSVTSTSIVVPGVAITSTLFLITGSLDENSFETIIDIFAPAAVSW